MSEQMIVTVLACGVPSLTDLFPMIAFWVLKQLAFAAAIIAVPLGLLTAIERTRAHRLRKRKIGGQCLKCGYDLRATPHRCPECGTVRERAIALPQAPISV